MDGLDMAHRICLHRHFQRHGGADGAGNPHPVMRHAAYRTHRKTELRTDFFHQRKIAAAPAAETEVIADQHEFSRQFFMQRIDEIRRAHLRETFIEAAHMHTIYAQRGKQLELLAQRGQVADPKRRPGRANLHQ